MTIAGDNRLSNRESGEPLATTNSSGTTVWYKWVSPVTQRVQVSALSDDFDSNYAIYTGSNVSSLTQVSIGTDGYNNGVQYVRSDASGFFSAVANTTYYVAMMGAEIFMRSLRQASSNGASRLAPVLLRHHPRLEPTVQFM